MTCFLYIPKASVGAVIGSRGSYINHVKQESRASCQVQERIDEPDAEDRPVMITGYPECVWKVGIMDISSLPFSPSLRPSPPSALLSLSVSLPLKIEKMAEKFFSIFFR